ncbi:acyl-CoA thioester hydrolase/BAAT C-terminal domain-containing protein [Microlunatus sp. GCM10028923]|uniref:alpha/beta hydrolase n=1 Tax=Microlunatus sp. GCM10028923 TaxID=3273400 RepID=UPI003618C6E7
MDVTVDRDQPRAAGLSGLLITPADGAAEGGVVLVGGSEGGLHEHDAMVLAGEGFAVLALAYFGAPGVPPVLKDLPLEYFSRGVEFLLGTGVRRVGILGGSRGGEAALLVASHDQRVAAAVSVVGSGVVTQGIDYTLGSVDVIMGTPTVAWTVGGVPLPALPNRVSADFTSAVASGGPVGLAAQYAPLPAEAAALDLISVPVERSDAAILLIAGERDAMWDSAAYHAVAAARLEAARHPRSWRNVVLPGAGHGIAGPPGPPITSTVSPGPGVAFELGGDPAATTAGRAEAWRLTVEFLREHLQD